MAPLLTEEDRKEADSLGERIRQMHRVPDWDEQAPFTQEETAGWVYLVLGIAGCMVLLLITAVALAPHLP